MQKLDACSEIISMAHGLKVDHRRPSEAIVAYCKSKIASWVSEAGKVKSVSEVQDVVCRNLGLNLVEVWSDEELDKVSAQYVALGEMVFASLSMQLNERTFATVMRREHATPKANDRFVAVVDCRGLKAARRFFTRWHEIAHILTLVTQMELPFQAFRSRDEGDPIERLMDMIAGEVGFYDPLFIPALVAETRKAGGRLSFDVVEKVRQQICPEASFQATLIACVKRTSTPVIQLEVAKKFKKAEEVRLKSGQSEMFPRPAPEAKLRAARSIPNPAAKASGFRVHPNMQIPGSSLVFKHFEESSDTDNSLAVSGVEDFASWRCSDGTVCGHGKIFVDVRKTAGNFVAILQPKP